MTQAELKFLNLMPLRLRAVYEAHLDICRFIIVGGAATLVHFTAALAVHHIFHASPLWSNFLAFCMAFIVTYLGNYFWAFESRAGHVGAGLKSLCVSLTGLGISQFIVWGLADQAGLPFYLSLCAALMIVPIVTFSLNRYWVFRREAA